MLNLQTCPFQRRILSVLFSFLLLLFFCLGMTSCRKSNPEATVQLWASEDNPLYSSLTAAVGEYNRQIRSGDLLSVSFRSFVEDWVCETQAARRGPRLSYHVARAALGAA